LEAARTVGGKSGVTMLKKTELREAAYNWIEKQPHNSQFGNADSYRFLETHFAAECCERGDASMEQRYKNDARWAVQDALGKTHGRKKIIERVGLGRFRRI
jgi:hypothetical protein